MFAASVRFVSSQSRQWACSILSATNTVSETAKDILAARCDVHQLNAADCIMLTEHLKSIHHVLKSWSVFTS